MGLIFYNKELFASDASGGRILHPKDERGRRLYYSAVHRFNVHGEDVLDKKLGAVKQPTLIIGAGRRAHAAAWASVYRDSRLASNVHVPQSRSRLEFNASLMRFLNGAK